MADLIGQIRKVLPGFVLDRIRKEKKKKRRRELARQKEQGSILNQQDLEDGLRKMGIGQGDTLMVHCRLSSLGYVEGGPEVLYQALRSALGPNGHLLMPSSPVRKLQLDFARQQRAVDLREIPSAMGALSEHMRKCPGVLRSTHPTEAVLAVGPKAEWLVSGHSSAAAPYAADSPFRRMMEFSGKILYLGVTLDNAGTHLHTLEDEVAFPFPVYTQEQFAFCVTDQKGITNEMKTRVHDPEWSRRRKCDELIPLFEEKGVLTRHRLGEAECLLLDASQMFQTMVQAFEERGVTMYHPKGRPS